MTFINLMPHRHRRLEQRRRRFLIGMGLSVLLACGAVLVASLALQRKLAGQAARNALLEQARAGLHKQEAMVRQLEAEIAALEQRRVTVGALQEQRAVPVALFNELARVAPSGLALTALRQSELKVTLNGVAASNERVSDLMGRLQSEATTLHQPELVELRAVASSRTARVGASGSVAPEPDNPAERMVEFTLTAQIRREGMVSEARP